MPNRKSLRESTSAAVALCTLFASTALGVPTPPRFEPRIVVHRVDTPELTWIWMVTDLNGDRIPDRMVRGHGDWFVFWGEADGSFRPGPTIPAASAPEFTLAVDMDDDGFADLISGSQDFSNAARIGIARGRGDGTFLPPVTSTFGVGAVTELAVVDIDADGRADLRAVIEHMECSDWECWSVSETHILRGDALGVLVDVSGALPYEFNRALFTDVNRDGRVDVVLGGLVVFLGDGSGRFAEPVSSNNVLSSAFAAGHVNGDGHIDLVGNVFERATSVFGNGDGTFRAGIEFGERIENARLVDWDRDGQLDLVLPESGQLSVLRGDGGGSFQRVAEYGLAGLAYHEYFLDADADGRLDLVFGTENRSFVIPAAPVGAFGRDLLVATAASASGAAVFDGNGDGAGDLIVGSGRSQSLLFPGDGLGGFGTPHTLPVPVAATQLVAQDMDRDGHTDVIAVHETADLLSVTYGVEGGGFEAPQSFPASAASERVRVGDVDGDGRPDVVTIPDFFDFFHSTRFDVTLANGPRSFGMPRQYATGAYVRDALPLGPDGAGRATLAVLTWRPSSGTNLVLYRSESVGLVQTTSIPLPTGAATLAAGDVDADGITDLLVGGAVLEIFRGAASGDFTVGPSLEAPAGITRIELADLDRSGDVDIAATQGDQTVRIWTARDPGQFAAPIDYGVLTLADGFVSGNVNGDGRPDLFVMNTRCGIVNMLASLPGTTPVRSFDLEASASSVTLSWSLGPDDLSSLRRIDVLRSSAVDGRFSVVAAFAELSPRMQFVDRDVRPGAEMWYAMSLHDRRGATFWVAARSVRTSPLATALDAPRGGAGGAIIFPYDVGGAGASVRLSLYDVRGRLVRALDTGWRDAGHYEVSWSPGRGIGGRTARGVYFARLSAGAFVGHRRVVVVHE